MLDKIKLRFEFLDKDPYKDREIVHIEIKQIGIPLPVIVRTPHPKVFRKDKYGYYRLVAAKVRGIKTKKATPKIAKKRGVHHVAQA